MNTVDIEKVFAEIGKLHIQNSLLIEQISVLQTQLAEARRTIATASEVACRPASE